MTPRIWDRFLTEQDREVASKSIHRPYGFGKKPCLLLIDLYRIALGESPQPILESIRKTPNSCGLAGWNSLPYTQKLLGASRQARIPIIFSTGLSEADCGVPGWVERGREKDVRHRMRSSGGASGGDYDIVDEVRPLDGEVVLEKTAPSVFCGTPLLPYLNSLGIDTIITCGESTSGCVRATVVEGRAFSYRMIVVEECVFDRTEASHAINLFDMNQKYADVLPLSVVLQYLKQLNTQEQVAALNSTQVENEQ